jgi:hypothetical protein
MPAPVATAVAPVTDTVNAVGTVVGTTLQAVQDGATKVDGQLGQVVGAARDVLP